MLLHKIFEFLSSFFRTSILVKAYVSGTVNFELNAHGLSEILPRFLLKIRKDCMFVFHRKREPEESVTNVHEK